MASLANSGSSKESDPSLESLPLPIPSFAFSMINNKEVSVSRQPILPQLHSLPFKKRGR
jgi:hypothetical protein